MNTQAHEVYGADETTRDVVPSVSIDNMLNQREAVAERFREAIRPDGRGHHHFQGGAPCVPTWSTA